MTVRALVSGLAPGEVALDAATSHYLARVLRLAAGDAFVAFDPVAAREADAEVLSARSERVVVRVGELREARLRGPEVTWVQGLPKGEKADAIVRDAVELGASRFVVAITRRTVVQLDPARARSRAERWTRIAREAARQSGRGDAPTVDAPVPWIDALAGVSDGAARFCLYEGATAPLGPPLLAALSSDEGRPIAFASGPEGGLEAEEVEAARERGWIIASLGPLVLRAETVAAAVLGAVRVWSGL